MEIFGKLVYGVKDATEAIPKMKPSSGSGRKGRYSYGGVRDLVVKRYPSKQPHRQGAYMLAENVAKADAILDARPRASKRLVGKEIETTDFFGVAIVSLEAYASYRGYSLSNIRKAYDRSPGFADLFTILHGGFLLDEAEFKDFVAWVEQFCGGPRPKRRKRSIGHRAALLDTRKTNPAKRVDAPIME